MISVCWVSWRDSASNTWGTRRRRNTTLPSCSASKLLNHRTWSHNHVSTNVPRSSCWIEHINAVSMCVDMWILECRKHTPKHTCTLTHTNGIFYCDSQWDSDQVWPLPGSQCSTGTRAAVSGARQTRWSYQALRNSKVSFKKNKTVIRYIHQR